MSDAWTVIEVDIDHTLEHTPEQLNQFAAAIEAVVLEHADWSGEYDNGSFTATNAGDHVVGRATVASRYEIDGAATAAEAVSAAWPLATVRLFRQWTGDGTPTQTTTIYRRGIAASAVSLEPVARNADGTLPAPRGHDVDVEDTTDLGGPYVLVAIPSDPVGGRSHTLAVAELTPADARELSAALLRAANGAEFRWNQLEKEQADA